MSRDHLLPAIFKTINKNGVPTISLLVTVAAVVFYVSAFEVLEIAKLASAFQLVLFALLCFAVIVMRESNIASYDPSFKTPFYPWIPLAGIFGPCWLITEMGAAPTMFAAGLVVLGVVWFFAYGNKRVDRGGAIFHVFERLGQRRFDGLDHELRGILKERGPRVSDPFEEIIAASEVLDADEAVDFDSVTRTAAQRLSTLVGHADDEISQGFLDGTRVGATPVTRGIALPHLRLKGLEAPSLVIVRSRKGIDITVGTVSGSVSSTQTVHAIFFLVSPNEDPAVHLRLLAQLAACVEQESFMDDWVAARDEDALREILLRDDRYLPLVLRPGTPTEVLIGVKVRDLGFPTGCLIAIIRRGASRP